MNRNVRSSDLRAATFVLAVTVFVGCTGAPLSQERGVTISETDTGYLFSEGADSVMVYHARSPQPHRAHSRSHYAHPLFALDGAVLTEDFPEDHLHQHGLYSAWHQLFVGDRRVGDGWEQEDVTWEVREVKVLDGVGSAALQARVVWISPNVSGTGHPEPFIEETATLRVYPAEARYREIDVTITLRALVDDVRIGGSEDEKGYGGLSLRVRLPDDVRFMGSGGPIEPGETAVEAGSWVDVSATYAESPSGVAIFQHPSNPDFPQAWILRSKASMQNPTWPGRLPVEIPTHESVTLRYRLVIHEGRADTLPLDDLYARYARD